ncbi:small integral membrane protein 27 [Manis javanica]|uniref:small integral membrane protein 27 n=1 Tax=Manis javanica TaxID=9974 RepID=UPI003C6D3FC3
MNPPPTPGGRSRPTDGKRFWRPVGGRPCPAERWPPHLGSRRPEVTLRPAVSTRSADRRRLLTMEPVNRRTLDWIYSLLLLAIVLLSWGYVIYASTVAARRQLRKEYPDKIFGMNENL